MDFYFLAVKKSNNRSCFRNGGQLTCFEGFEQILLTAHCKNTFVNGAIWRVIEFWSKKNGDKKIILCNFSGFPVS